MREAKREQPRYPSDAVYLDGWLNQQLLEHGQPVYQEPGMGGLPPVEGGAREMSSSLKVIAGERPQRAQ